MKNRFEQVYSTVNEKIVGPSGIPFTVELPDFVRKHIFNSDYKNYRAFIENMPRWFTGKMIRKKRTCDFMSIDGCFVPIGIISEKFKSTLEDLMVSTSEYDLIPMRIKDFDDVFYIMFAPVILYENLNFKESIFTDDDLDEDIGIRYYKYDSYQSYLEAPEEQRDAYELVLDKKYEKYDIIKFNYLQIYFSPRLQKAIEENGIVGVSYYGRRSDFYVKLSFK